jgi:hypothetical protein
MAILISPRSGICSQNEVFFGRRWIGATGCTPVKRNILNLQQLSLIPQVRTAFDRTARIATNCNYSAKNGWKK